MTPPSSPQWGTATKSIVATMFLILVGFVVVRFQEMVVPLIFSFITASILNPVAERVSRRWHLSWGGAVNLIYGILVVALISLIVAAGIAIEQQFVTLYTSVIELITDLPARVETLFSQVIVLGPFRLDLSSTNLQPLYEQALSAVQPALSQTGALVGTLATSTASLIAWIFFILIISYYLLHDLKNLLPSIEHLVPPLYVEDARRLMAALGPIWNNFLRGQITLSISMGLIVGITMTVLQVRYSPILGLLAALAEFAPVVGPFVSLTVGTLVAFFQASNWLGLDPFYFALVIAIIYIILQQIENNVLYPRILGQSLHLHPILILVGAIIGANLAGILGLLLAAPILATLRLFGGYAYRKVFDLDPWPESEPAPPPEPRASWRDWFKRFF